MQQIVRTIFFFLIVATVASGDDQILGRATVIDGDTIEIAGQRIRLNGIDAPESWQKCNRLNGSVYRCGQVSALALDEFLKASRPTRCEPVGSVTYDRAVANCFRSDGKSAATWLVESGHAVDWPKYSHGAYKQDQDRAQASRVGIWQGEFDLPCIARNRKAPKC